MSGHDSIHGHRNLNETERSVIARLTHRKFVTVRMLRHGLSHTHCAIAEWVFVVFVESFHLSALFSNDLLCSPWKGKAWKCAPSHHRRRHPWGVSLRERPRRFHEEVTAFACRGGLRRWRKANLQIVKRCVEDCSSSPSSFFWRNDNQRSHGNLTFERGSVWKSGSRVGRHFDAIDSRESQFRSSHRYTRKSGEYFVGQSNSQLFVEYKTCEGSDYMSTKGQAAAALLMDSSMNSGLDFSSFTLV